jgi:hypothetical protein
MTHPLQQAILAIKANDKKRGKRLLKQVLASDPNNEQAWGMLVDLVEHDSQRRSCLERIVAINPHNLTAQRRLADLQASATASTDHTIRLLKTQFIRPPCQWISRNLSSAEWGRYLDGRPYEVVCPE